MRYSLIVMGLVVSGFCGSVYACGGGGCGECEYWDYWVQRCVRYGNCWDGCGNCCTCRNCWCESDEEPPNCYWCINCQLVRKQCPNLCEDCNDVDGLCYTRCKENLCETCNTTTSNCYVNCWGCTTCINGLCRDDDTKCGFCERCAWGSCQSCYNDSENHAWEDCTNRVPNPYWTPQPDGCSAPLLGDNPAGCPNTNFHEVCDQHDICYQTCNNQKTTCDSAFGNALMNFCAGVPQGKCRNDCIYWASWYVWAVGEFGYIFYAADQSAACACCDCN